VNSVPSKHPPPMPQPSSPSFAALRRRTFLPLLAALALPALAACGGTDESASAQAEAPMRDTTAPPIERQPLGEVDRLGAEPFNLVIELPWTTNRARRDSEPAAAQAELRELETLSTDDFDRVVFTFADFAAFPGYQVHLVDSTTVACGTEEADGETDEEGASVTLEGDAEQALVVRIQPARTQAEGSAVPTGQATIGQSHFVEGGLICAQDRALVWASSVSQGSEIRVLELREPHRLVVDLR